MALDRRTAWTAALAAVVAFLPFARGALAGQCLYFRDLSREFFPLRAFVVDGLLHGELRYWNPLVHEGVPLSLPPLSYPLDLLQLLRPDQAGFSLLLALHAPLGALAFFALARGLGLSRAAAAGGGIAYVLGGFFLSTLNLYVYVQAAAWAPLVALGLIRAADGDRRWRAGAATLLAVAISTTGVEIVLQAVLFGVALAGLPFRPRRMARLAGVLALGVGLSGGSWLVVRSMVAGSARGAGLPVEVVVSQSIHPVTLVQMLVGNWHGDLANLTNKWWGSNFFPLGFPYFLSFYLGAALLAVASVGALHGRGPRKRLLVLTALGLLVCLGRWAGLSALVEMVPLARLFRFPSKAFFSVHFAACLLAALGLDRLGREDALRPWATLAALGVALGGALAAVPALPLLAPDAVRSFLEGFLPPAYSWTSRLQVAQTIWGDAALGGWMTAALLLPALAALLRRTSPRAAAVGVAAIVATDLLRTGAGLNPMVTPAFYRLSPEMTRVAAELRGAGGRTFTCDPREGPAYFAARRWHAEHDVWTFAVFMETLTPAFNMDARVPTALSKDLTMLVPEHLVLSPDEVGAAAFPAVAGRLARAGVSRVLCLEPLSSPALSLREAVAPARIAPLALHVYDLAGAPPLRAVARDVHRAGDRDQAEALAGAPGFGGRGAVAVEGAVAEVTGASGRVVAAREGADRLELEAEADRATVLVIRDAFAPGWRATVDGSPAPVLRADGRHRAVPIPPGRSRIVLSYHPPGLAAGAWLSAASLCVVALLGWRRGRGGIAAEAEKDARDASIRATP